MINYKMPGRRQDLAEHDSQGYSRLFVASTLVFLLSITAMMIPDRIHPEEYELPDPPSLSGPLSKNDGLKAAYIVNNSIKGPESFDFHNDFMYTGTSDGKIMKVGRDGKASVLADLGDCSTSKKCGRPLGIRLDSSKKRLVVADAYVGVYTVDIANGKVEKKFPLKKDLKVTFFDDFDFVHDDEIVLSEASTRFYYHELLPLVMESSGNGRLLRINLKTEDYEIIRDGLYVPNGVQRDLRDDSRESFLVAETLRNRIVRVFIRGQRKGQTEVFADNLPGAPDNLRPTENGDGYWVAIAMVRTKEHSDQSHELSRWPFLRRLIFKITPSSLMSYAHPSYGLAIKLDLSGRIVSSLHDTNGSVIPSMTQISEHAGSLYFGNFDSINLAVLDQSCKKHGNCFFNKLK